MLSKFGSLRFGLIVLVGAIAIALLLSPASALSASKDTARNNASPVASITISAAQQKAALDFWTKDAIAKAKPMMIALQAGPADAPMAGAQEALGMPVGSSPSGLAAPDADKIARAAYPDDWKPTPDNAVAALAPDGTSQTFTSYVVNQWQPAQTIYPHKWVGRLSFRTAGGTSYCSGTSISGNVMLTAAHCLYDTTNNVWYSQWVFTPAYRNGSAPYGSFAATTCWVLTAWVNLSGSFSINGWTKYDVGVCKMGNNGQGQPLNTAVGWMGRQWNYGYVRSFFDLGYPWKNTSNVSIPNAGLYLRTCTAESFQQTTDTLGMGCNWGPGISGGPWMTSYSPPNVNGYANSVNSGLYIGTQNLYGIRFNSNNIVPLCTAAGC